MNAVELERLFTYQPPTDETRPKYMTIDAALTAAVLLMDHVRIGVHGGAHAAQIPAIDLREPEVRSDVFVRVTTSFLAFAQVINEQAPESADKTAAIPCVRLARNAVNEWLWQSVRKPTSTELLELAHSELLKARWQANAAIALEVKPS